MSRRWLLQSGFLLVSIMAHGQSDTLEAYKYYVKGYSKELFRDYQGALKEFDSSIFLEYTKVR